MWETYKEHFGKEDDEILVVQGLTQLMNPTVSRQVIDSAYEKDPAVAAAEHGAEFRQDLESFISEAVLGACIIDRRHELPPMTSEYTYSAGVDPSGGGPDEFSLVICHGEDDRIVQDVVRGWKGDRPNDAVKEASDLLKQYRVRQVTGDKYAGEWPKQSFADQGIEYRFSDKTASEAFLELLPTLNQGNIELLDDQKQTNQLLALERKKGRSGKDSIAHPPGGHDDRAVALALAVSQTSPAVVYVASDIHVSRPVNWSTMRTEHGWLGPPEWDLPERW